MTWRDRLRPASFRGIPFFVETSEAGFSRNVVEHEYPGQAAPFFEDLGRRARSFTVEGYVVGDDYQAQRDRLVAAVDSETGAGDLVHPYFGSLKVHARGLAVRESTREGRMARLLFEFVEASQAVAPSNVEDPGTTLVLATGSLFKASGTDFVDTWDPVDKPSTLVEAGAAQAEDFWSYLRELQLRGPTAKVGEWLRDFEELSDSTETKLRTPSVFADEVSRLLDRLTDAVGSRRSAVEAFLGLGKVKVSSSFGSSKSSQAADRNRDAVGRLFRESAAALAARATGEQGFTNYDDAIAARTRALEAISAAQDTAQDAAFRELSSVSRALTDALPLAPGTLPRIEGYDVLEATSTLVLAYRLFDDVARAEEIADRNEIANPLTVAGGQRLEVLSRV